MVEVLSFWLSLWGERWPDSHGWSVPVREGRPVIRRSDCPCEGQMASQIAEDFGCPCEGAVSEPPPHS